MTLSHYRRLVAILLALAVGALYMFAPMKGYGQNITINHAVLNPRLVLAAMLAGALILAEPWAMLLIEKKAPRWLELAALAVLGASVLIPLLVWLF